MIDPVSAYAAATAAYKGVKMLIQAGKDIEDVSKHLGSWYGAVADITRAESQRKNTTWLKKNSTARHQLNSRRWTSRSAPKN